MHQLPERNRKILAKKISYYKQKCFPGKGSGIRLAEEIDTTPQALSNWISGRRLPSIVQVYKLAKAFDVSPLELCGLRRKNTLNHKSLHVTMLLKLLRYCESDIIKNVNPQITYKFLVEIKSLFESEL